MRANEIVNSGYSARSILFKVIKSEDLNSKWLPHKGFNTNRVKYLHIVLEGTWIKKIIKKVKWAFKRKKTEGKTGSKLRPRPAIRDPTNANDSMSHKSLLEDTFKGIGVCNINEKKLAICIKRLERGKSGLMEQRGLDTGGNLMETN